MFFTLLDILWWTCSCSYLFYVGMLLHIGVLFMVLFPDFQEIDFV
jgi:hypothetical protein